MKDRKLFTVANLSQGDVFYMTHEEVDGIHYMVIINREPQYNEVLVLGVMTTKIEKRKEFIRLNNLNPLSLVEFTYKKKNAVDCNQVKIIKKDELMDKLKRGECKISDPVDKVIMDKIFDGIICSKIAQRYKEIVQNIRQR